MKFKRFGAMLLALVMCTGVFSTTAFAYSDESAATPTTEKAERSDFRGSSVHRDRR